jgi:DNA-binding NtrC family response regulator
MDVLDALRPSPCMSDCHQAPAAFQMSWKVYRVWCANMPQPWILLVEDDADSRESLLDVLSDAGFLAKGAASVAAALSLLHGKDPPCAVICDIVMPMSSGIDLVLAMHKDPILQSVPVTLVSGLIPISLPAGVKVAASLSKPFSIDEIVACMEQQCPEARVVPSSES